MVAKRDNTHTNIKSTIQKYPWKINVNSLQEDFSILVLHEYIQFLFKITSHHPPELADEIADSGASWSETSATK
jgi:hypothetical protein